MSRSALATGLALARTSPLELVVACAAIGDSITPDELDAMLLTTSPRTELEHDVVALTLNEQLADAGMDHPVPSSEELAGRAWTADRPR